MFCYHKMPECKDESFIGLIFPIVEKFKQQDTLICQRFHFNLMGNATWWEHKQERSLGKGGNKKWGNIDHKLS